MQKLDFSGNSAIVSRAGAGIGRASARLLASPGASVVVNEINADTAQETLDAMHRSGGRCSLFVGD